MNEEIRELIDTFRVLQVMTRDRHYTIVDDGKTFELQNDDHGIYFRILYGFRGPIQLQLGNSYDGKMTPPQKAKYGYMSLENSGDLFNRSLAIHVKHIYKLKDEEQLKEILEKYITRQ